jgi:ferritin-like metal-binding protein YciE
MSLCREDIKMKTLQDAFEHTLQDIYWAENALLKALPKVAKSVGNAELKQAVDDHLKETKGHVTTLEAVFKSVGLKASGEKCDAMAGLLKEADGLIDEAEGHALDVAMIGAAQAVEHYEIARYGTLREWAKVLGHNEAHELLTSILDEEKAANAKLTTLAVTAINAAGSSSNKK